MSTVVLIRPGATDYDEQNRIQGSLELPLSDRGQEQVRRLIDQLRDIPLDVIYTAPCDPARTTAEVIGAELGVRVKQTEDLCNLDQGLWEGLQVEDVRHKFPRVFKQWLEAPETICPPEGETVPQALERVCKALRKPLRKKGAFGIVASEPLASLISCYLRNARPELGEPACRPANGRLVEFLRTDATANGDGGVNGTAAAGATAAANGNPVANGTAARPEASAGGGPEDHSDMPSSEPLTLWPVER